MYFQISPSGRRSFRLKYRLDGKENSMLLGVYPVHSLKEAREEALKAKKLINDGINPNKEREKIKQKRIEESQDTFKRIAEDWFSFKKPGWSEERQNTVRRVLEKRLYPCIGDMSIKEITQPQILNALNHIVNQGHYSVVKRARQFADKVFVFAISEGKADRNPATGLEYRLPSPPKTKHRPAIISPKKLGTLLLGIDAYEGGGKSVVKYALRLMPLVFVRSKELRFAEWKNIDWDESQYYVGDEKMKMKEEHVVPLSRQAIKILKDVHRFTGKGRYVFPSRDSLERPIGRGSMSRALKLIIPEKEMSVHGFRATARTMLREQLKQPVDWIETQLAHASRDPLAGAYDRAIYLEDRREMMQKWADYLDQLKQEAAWQQQTGDNS